MSNPEMALQHMARRLPYGHVTLCSKLYIPVVSDCSNANLSRRQPCLPTHCFSHLPQLLSVRHKLSVRPNRLVVFAGGAIAGVVIAAVVLAAVLAFAVTAIAKRPLSYMRCVLVPFSR